MSDLSQKYDFLLHPIKDLTENWNVDIAAVLEDFLEELEKITFSFDGGKTTLNFAEASYLIQGTTCVWSRKVESLHNLVYQTLDMIRNNKNNKQTATTDGLGEDADATFDNHEDKFLNLDDNRTLMKKRFHDGGAEVICIPKHCVYLQTLEESRGSPFYNKNGEIINHSRDFWCNTMIPQGRGVVLIDQKFETTPVHSKQEQTNTGSGIETLETPATDFLDDLDSSHDDISMLPEEIHTIVEQTEEVKHELRCRDAKPSLENKTVSEEPVTELPLLDPHCVCKDWQMAPFKKGKTVRYPASLAKNTKKRKKEPLTPTLPVISEFLKSSRQLVRGHASNYMKEERKRRNERQKQLRSIYFPHPLHSDAKPQFERDEDAGMQEDIMEGFDSDDAAPDEDCLVNDIERNVSAQENVQLENVETYEDLVRHHVERFYTSARRNVQESALSQRVREWQHVVEPFLDEQDSRPEFDIHKYGDAMVSNFSHVGETKSFKSCVVGQDRWSICRQFAATLQLANDENFQLVTEHTDAEATSGDSAPQGLINTLKLKLLTHNKLRERIGDYAPS